VALRVLIELEAQLPRGAGESLAAGSIPSQVIEADVSDNAVDPGREGALESEAIQLLVSF
jgi:hypothetical protein